MSVLAFVSQPVDAHSREAAWKWQPSGEKMQMMLKSVIYDVVTQCGIGDAINLPDELLYLKQKASVAAADLASCN